MAAETGSAARGRPETVAATMAPEGETGKGESDGICWPKSQEQSIRQALKPS